MPKSKLSETQLVILSTAAKADRPIGRDNLNKLKAQGTPLTRAVNGLIKRGLLGAAPVEQQVAQWRKTKMGDSVGLAITSAGLRWSCFAKVESTY